MKEQIEMEELSQVIEHEREDQIKQLEEQLSKEKETAHNNKNAADILTRMLNEGDVKIDDAGNVSIVKGPNEIKNVGDVNM